MTESFMNSVTTSILIMKMRDFKFLSLRPDCHDQWRFVMSHDKIVEHFYFGGWTTLFVFNAPQTALFLYEGLNTT